MSTTTTMTFTEFEAWADQRDEVYELVDGVPRMVPHESISNLRATSALHHQLVVALPAGSYLVLHHPGVAVTDAYIPGVRVPDLAVARERGQNGRRLTADDIVLVVEALSPSTAHIDRHEKRADYAAAGIPAYLIIDTRPDVPLLTLHDERGTTTGEDVDVRIDGHTLTVRGADLMP
ncbi:MAG: Uma2 family endonuclease [Mobilicoccus sp.]|nr:Uma2 family endonuclease [Mobilicoccus sp.]